MPISNMTPEGQARLNATLTQRQARIAASLPANQEALIEGNTVVVRNRPVAPPPSPLASLGSGQPDQERIPGTIANALGSLTPPALFEGGVRAFRQTSEGIMDSLNRSTQVSAEESKFAQDIQNQLPQGFTVTPRAGDYGTPAPAVHLSAISAPATQTPKAPLRADAFSPGGFQREFMANTASRELATTGTSRAGAPQETPARVYEGQDASKVREGIRSGALTGGGSITIDGKTTAFLEDQGGGGGGSSSGMVPGPVTPEEIFSSLPATEQAFVRATKGQLDEQTLRDKEAMLALRARMQEAQGEISAVRKVENELDSQYRELSKQAKTMLKGRTAREIRVGIEMAQNAQELSQKLAQTKAARLSATAQTNAMQEQLMATERMLQSRDQDNFYRAMDELSMEKARAALGTDSKALANVRVLLSAQNQLSRQAKAIQEQLVNLDTAQMTEDQRQAQMGALQAELSAIEQKSQTMQRLTDTELLGSQSGAGQAGPDGLPTSAPVLDPGPQAAYERFLKMSPGADKYLSREDAARVLKTQPQPR